MILFYALVLLAGLIGSWVTAVVIVWAVRNGHLIIPVKR